MTIEPRTDLTRWNRTGVSHFDYVDGNAATFLEDLRTAMLARYLRGVAGDPRKADYWRDLFSADPATWPAAQALLPHLQWETLGQAFPDQQEVSGKGNERLIAAYDARSGDYAYEIMRAAARAAHVLAGHVSAYANEGYLRTATQWESLRRLAAMVNYHPTPSASAFTEVAMIAAGSAPASLVDRGLAMKVSPPEGGKPVIFETLRPAWVHPALNAMQARNARRDERSLRSNAAAVFALEGQPAPVIGDLCAIATAGMGVHAAAVTGVTVNDDDTAHIAPAGGFPAQDRLRADTRLMLAPGGILRGTMRQHAGSLAIEVANPTQFQAGAVTRMVDPMGHETFAVIERVEGSTVVLSTAVVPADQVTLTPLTPHQAGSGRTYEVSPEIIDIYYNVNGVLHSESLSTPQRWILYLIGSYIPRQRAVRNANGVDVAVATVFEGRGSDGRSFSFTPGTPSVQGRVQPPRPPIPGLPDLPANTFTFVGKPPKGLAVGDVFVSRHQSTLTGLLVVGLQTTADRFDLQFDPAPVVTAGGLADDLEFNGPFKRELRTVNFDRSHDPAVAAGGRIDFIDIPTDAASLMTPGRSLIIEDQSPAARTPVLATVQGVSWDSSQTVLTVSIADVGTALANFTKGWTVFRGNTVRAGHGESQGSRVIGSGNGELAAQAFNLPLTDISFVPSTASETGFAPDIDVRVGDSIWELRDLADVEAEGDEAYSPALADDGTLDLHFRRRLSTGVDNVVVVRHRVGSGLRGNGVAPYSFKKPSNKHAVVTALVQPFATGGGSEREPPGDIRVNAPGRLSANDRAVSLADFARLARRNASVWQARASLKLAAGREQVVDLTVVPAGGGALSESLRIAIGDFLLAKSLPNVRIDVAGFVSLPVAIHASLILDTQHYDRDRTEDAVRQALFAAFTLKRRSLGQGLFIGEILAALESVAGVEHAIATVALAGAPPTRAPRSSPSSQGGFSALFPWPDQVAYLASPNDIALETN